MLPFLSIDSFTAISAQESGESTRRRMMRAHIVGWWVIESENISSKSVRRIECGRKAILRMFSLAVAAVDSSSR